MKNFKKRGFTLIELLIVIAILGVLSSVILANLGTAREKGKTAAFKGEMDSFRKAIEVVYTDNNSYNGIFLNGTAADIATSTVPDANLQTLLTSIANRASDGQIYGGISAPGDAYAVYGRLPGTDPTSLVAADIWCVDNLGNSGNPTADATTEFTTAASVCW